MTLLGDLQGLREELNQVSAQVETNRSGVERHEEQINGDRGLSKGLAALNEEIRSLKRAIWTVGAGIVLSAVGFCFTVLTVFGAS